MHFLICSVLFSILIQDLLATICSLNLPVYLDWPCGIDWTAGRLMFVHFIIELENYEIIRINAYHDLKFTLPVSTGSKPQSDSA